MLGPRPGRCPPRCHETPGPPHRDASVSSHHRRRWLPHGAQPAAMVAQVRGTARRWPWPSRQRAGGSFRRPSDGRPEIVVNNPKGAPGARCAAGARPDPPGRARTGEALLTRRAGAAGLCQSRGPPGGGSAHAPERAGVAAGIRHANAERGGHSREPGGADGPKGRPLRYADETDGMIWPGWGLAHPLPPSSGVGRRPRQWSATAPGCALRPAVADLDRRGLARRVFPAAPWLVS